MSTPVRKQYLNIKAQYPDAIVLFRIGDFYETFDEDAVVASRDLEIILTQRDMGKGVVVPLAGIPYHSIDTYLSRLIKKGHRVAVCEQIGVPTNRKLVEREVVRVVTPGTVVEPSILENGVNNYLAALISNSHRTGLAVVDISTGEFMVTEIDVEMASRELSRLNPVEILVCENNDLLLDGYNLTKITDEFNNHEHAKVALLKHFQVSSLNSFGCADFSLGISAVASIISYLNKTNYPALQQLTNLHAYSTEDFMALDVQTVKNLEIFESGKWGEGKAALISLIDETFTPMGRRLLRRWFGEPLVDINKINQRLEIVDWFNTKPYERQLVQSKLKNISDLERILKRVGVGIALPREVAALRKSLDQIPELIEIILNHHNAHIKIIDTIPNTEAVVALIQQTINDEPSGELGKGGIVRNGFSSDLDEFRKASNDARGYIAGLEKQERERTGIGNLKVGYNKVFGYYLEVSNSHVHKVPTDYIRRQTLTGGERYITPELKEYESKVLNAKESVEALEVDVFKKLCDQIRSFTQEITDSARVVARLDVFCSLAEVASANRYVRPVLNNSSSIKIIDGRHPVAENIALVNDFIPNDIELSNDEEQIIILTGPNMSGKSTYLRQVALIVLMAQIGSFVPASKAEIGIVDRIFTRVGLQDDLGAGQSTFMVEMLETAAILNQATKKSLLILDEIGRGTSTYDGMSIAQSVIEYIHDNPNLGCKALFATHYHELTSLAARLDRVRNYKVAVEESDRGVTFLHQIIPGGADKSYGVHVASLAGLPSSVVTRSWDLLNQHESQYQKKTKELTGIQSLQLPLFEVSSPVNKKIVSILEKTEPDHMAPIEALNLIFQLKSILDRPDKVSGNDSI